MLNPRWCGFTTFAPEGRRASKKKKKKGS